MADFASSHQDVAADRQRLDLLGVKKEDLPAIWADLNAAGLWLGSIV